MAEHLKNIKETSKKLWKLLLSGDNTAKVFFIILSVFLWLLIKLSKEGYTGNISFPVQYVNVPANKKLLNQPTDQLKVSIRSHGFEILKYKLRSLRPLKIDVSSLDGTSEEHYTWSTRSQRDVVVSQFDDNTEVLNIQPDTVDFHFSIIRSKMVKVYFNGKRQVSDFKTLYATPEIVPDSIMISGSQEALDKVDSVFTKFIEPGPETDSLKVKVGLESPGKNVEVNQKQVQVKALYTSLTEGKFEIPVEVINLPRKYNITLFPNRVFVKYQLSVEDFSKVKKDDFHAYVDYADIESMANDRFLTVYLKSTSSYAKKVTLDPKQLEYIITEK